MSKKKKPNLKKPETPETGKQKGRSPQAVEISLPGPESERAKEAALAKLYLRPTVLAAATIKGQYAKDDHININALVDELGDQAALVQKGDMGRAEAMLISQAHALDALFAELVSRARMNIGHYPDAMNKYMNLALRAQSQCRATLEGLAEIKNPRPYIQNNKAQYQQVNNGQLLPVPHAHTEEKLKPTNGLLEDQSHEWMDTGATAATGGDDKALEAVEIVNGTENR